MADGPFRIFRQREEADSLRDRALSASSRSLLPPIDALLVRMYRVLVSHYPGFGYDAFADLYLYQWGGLLGLDVADTSDDPDLAAAREELARKRGPSPDRKG